MKKRRVVITGTGMITALGDRREELHEALCSGRRGLKRAELFDDPRLLGKPLVGEITAFEPSAYLGQCNFRPLDRTSQLLISATRLAVDDAGWTVEALERQSVGLVAGTMFCSLQTISSFDRRALEEGPSCASPLDFANTVINAAAGQTGIWHNLRGVNSTISTGITSALEAISYASGLIRDGHETTILAGGVESLCTEALLAFQRVDLLVEATPDSSTFPVPFSSQRHGFALAEGAAFLVLEERESALERGAKILGEFQGAGSRFDCSPPDETTDSALQRRAACVADAVTLALDDAQLHVGDVHAVCAGANGNRFTDQAEAVGLANLSSDFAALPVTAIKSMMGESLGASAAMQTIDALSTLCDGRMPGVPGWSESNCDFKSGSVSCRARQVDPRTCLITSLGLDGHCSALVLGHSHYN